MARTSASERARQAIYSRPFTSDAEFFRQRPSAICRIRPWRNEDDEHVIGSRGCETEFYTASIVFRDGRIYAAYFPDPFARGKIPLRTRVDHWAIEMMAYDRMRRQP